MSTDLETLRERLQKASASLVGLAGEVSDERRRAGGVAEARYSHLLSKKQGVDLAVGYIDEMLRDPAAWGRNEVLMPREPALVTGPVALPPHPADCPFCNPTGVYRCSCGDEFTEAIDLADHVEHNRGRLEIHVPLSATKVIVDG